MKFDFKLTQPQRLASLCIDLVIVLLACWYLFGVFYPPIGDKGFWGYSALLAVLIGSKLVTPFYVKPADAISYAVPAFVSLMLINDWGNWSLNQKWGFSLAASYSLIVFVLGLANIVSNAINSEWASILSNRIRISLEYFGRPEFIYTPLVLFAIFSYHLGSSLEVAIICIVVGTTVWWSLGDFLIGVFYKFKSVFENKALVGVAGKIVAFQEPSIILLRQQYEGDINKHDILLVHDKHAPSKLVVALDYVGRLEGVLVRAVAIKELSDKTKRLVGPMPFSEVAYSLDGQVMRAVCESESIKIDEQVNIVGLVSQDSSIERLFFEVVDGKDLEEGRLVAAYVGNKKVLYQIVGGLTKEEVVQQKNTFGYIRGQAQQIGIWDEVAEKFSQCNWLPNINAPIYLIGEKEEGGFKVESVGTFPKTNFQIAIKNINELVTHNTAILGILGVGKSMLSVELVERMLTSNIKVLCIDLTDEYKLLMDGYYVEWFHNKIIAELNIIAGKSKTNISKNQEDGGGVKQFKEYMYGCLDDLSSNPDVNLMVINPSDFEVWRQDSKPYNNEASMASLTPTEITQIISEAALKVMQSKGKPHDGAARLCLVYEEAHSLVPEFNSVVAAGDKSATNGTARAILQGRKYGMGCMLITQRTANVTKTILNQCNTIFAMRTFDDTGKEFLSNYLGRSYSESLHNLQPRQAVFFGKASSCENPVLMRLNDRDRFIEGFRAINPVPEITPPPPPPPLPLPDEVIDDVPF
jgi:hypothetical protein